MSVEVSEQGVLELGVDISELDLSMIKLKLQDKEEGLGWTVSMCDAVEIEYKRFLVLKRAFPLNEIVPNKQIDAFWHQHILDTEKYARDCDVLFGHFIHHYPYFGMKDEEDYRNLCDAFEETKLLYERHFGVPYAENTMLAHAKCRTSRCRTQCKPVKCK